MHLHMHAVSECRGIETQWRLSVIHLILINWETDQNVALHPHVVRYFLVLHRDSF